MLTSDILPMMMLVKYLYRNKLYGIKVGRLIGINPYLMNGFSHHYQLDESTFIFRGVRSDF